MLTRPKLKSNKCHLRRFELLQGGQNFFEKIRTFSEEIRTIFEKKIRTICTIFEKKIRIIRTFFLKNPYI